MKKRKIYTNTCPDELVVTEKYTYITTNVTKVTHEEEGMTTTHYECEQDIYANEEYIIKMSEKIKNVEEKAEKTQIETEKLKEEAAENSLEERMQDLELAMMEVAYADGNVYGEDDN